VPIAFGSMLSDKSTLSKSSGIPPVDRADEGADAQQGVDTERPLEHSELDVCPTMKYMKFRKKKYMKFRKNLPIMSSPIAQMKEPMRSRELTPSALLSTVSSTSLAAESSAVPAIEPPTRQLPPGLHSLTKGITTSKLSLGLVCVTRVQPPPERAMSQ